MSKKLKQQVDITEWVSQMHLANKLEVTPGAVRNWINRGQIDSWYVPELRMTLVKNLTSIKELKERKKKL
jgi:hypothetical protein